MRYSKARTQAPPDTVVPPFGHVQLPDLPVRLRFPWFDAFANGLAHREESFGRAAS